jgi:IS30 family transposase
VQIPPLSGLNKAELVELCKTHGIESCESKEQMVQQLSQMVIQALQQGMQPEQIIQMLVQQGIPQEVAVQILQMVMLFKQRIYLNLLTLLPEP